MVKNVERKYFVTDILKSSLLSIIIGVILVLILAAIANFVAIPSGVLTGINQAIKVVSVFLGCFFGFKEKKSGIVKGALAGLIYSLTITLIFGLIKKSLSFGASAWIDAGLSLVIGAISGIIAVNIGKDRKTQQ
jgi:putative membrane protein (TIGR04086 family)